MARGICDVIPERERLRAHPESHASYQDSGSVRFAACPE
ncbi:hypothetical protein OCAR_6977 [Afipia carboxidovorans OM5]|nr:hypothetical protein OCAR_6977 [Afipia carboxidovorans OM5]